MIDSYVRDFFLSVQTPLIIQISTAISMLVYFLILASAIYLYKKDKQSLLKLGIGLIALFLLDEVLKVATGRLRPNNEPGSFPSNHAALSFFVAGFFPEKKYKVALFGIAFLVAISRLALNVHWFSDVLAGSILGFAFAKLLEKIKIKLKLAESKHPRL